MAEDFGVVPRVGVPRDAASAFRAADRPAAGARGLLSIARDSWTSRVCWVRREPGHLGVSSTAERRAEAVRPGVAPPPPSATDDLVAVEETLRLFECASTDTRKTPRASRRERARRRAQRARHARTIRRRRLEEGDETVEARRVSSASGGGASRRERGGVRGPSSRRARHATRRRGCGRAEMDRIRGAGVGLRDDPPGRRGDFACA